MNRKRILVEDSYVTQSISDFLLYGAYENMNGTIVRKHPLYDLIDDNCEHRPSLCCAACKPFWDAMDEMEENLRRYDAPLKKIVCEFFPEYIENPNRYGVDLIPRNRRLRHPMNGLFLPSIELQVATYWKRRTFLPSKILIRYRKEHLLTASILIWTFYRGMKDFFSIRGDKVVKVIREENIELEKVNEHDYKDVGYWIPTRHFTYCKLRK